MEKWDVVKGIPKALGRNDVRGGVLLGAGGYRLFDRLFLEDSAHFNFLNDVGVSALVIGIGLFLMIARKDKGDDIR